MLPLLRRRRKLSDARLSSGGAAYAAQLMPRPKDICFVCKAKGVPSKLREGRVIKPVSPENAVGLWGDETAVGAVWSEETLEDDVLRIDTPRMAGGPDSPLADLPDCAVLPAAEGVLDDEIDGANELKFLGVVEEPEMLEPGGPIGDISPTLHKGWLFPASRSELSIFLSFFRSSSVPEGLVGEACIFLRFRVSGIYGEMMLLATVERVILLLLTVAVGAIRLKVGGACLVCWPA